MSKKVRNRSIEDPEKPKKLGARIYAYFNPQLNKYQDPPEDPNAIVEWDKYTPSILMPEVAVVGNRMTDEEQKAYSKKINNAQLFGGQIEQEIESKDPERKQYSLEELDKLHKESVNYFWDKQLEEKEAARAAREKEKLRLMQEFVDNENAHKSSLQAYYGNLTLENPATRDAARNYAEYKLGESSPLWASDRLLTGHDEPTTRDFYRPHEATFSFGIPAAVATAVAAAPAAVAGIGAVPAIGEGVASFLSLPVVNPVTGAAIAEGTLTFGNALNAYFIAHGVKSIPETYKAWEKAFTADDSKEDLKDVKDAAIQTLYNALDFVGAGEGKAGVKLIAKDISKGYNYAKNFTKEGYNVAKEAVGKTLNTIDNNKYYQALTLQDKTGVMSKKVKAANTAMMDAYDAEVPVAKEFSETIAEKTKRDMVVRRKYNKYERYPFVDGQKTLENQARVQAIEKSQNFSKEGETLTTAEGSRFNAVTKTGEGTIVDFKTGKFITAKVEPIGKKLVYKKGTTEDLSGFSENFQKVAAKNKTYETVTSETVTSSGQAAPEYVETLKSNIQYVEETIPGAKIFGSSVGVTEGGLPHLTGDLDALITESAYKSNVSGAYKHLETKGPAEVHDFGIGGEGGHIDFNIIHENFDGTVKVVWKEMYPGGPQRSLEIELFKQVDPDGFYKAAEEAIAKGTPGNIKIPYKAQELLDKVDPAVKTIMDAYESTKAKHMNRIDSYINFGNPEVVAKAQQQYAKSQVGGKGTVGPQFSTEALSDVAKNKNILADIGFIGEVEVVAKSPERMQLALNDYYINNSIYTRQVDAVNDFGIKFSLDTVKNSLKEWRPTGIGSGQSLNGWGINTTQHANPGWKTKPSEITGNRQIGLKVSSESPTQMVADVKRQTDGFYIFTPEEKDVLLGIFKSVVSKAEAEQMAAGVTKTMDLLQLPTGKTMKTQKIFNEVTKQLGIKASTTGNTFNEGWYSSMLGDFDEAIDALAFTFNKTATPPKSYLQRERGLNSVTVPTPPSIQDVKEFTLIENYVNGGVEKARARADEYMDSLKKIHSDLKRLEDHYSKDLKDKILELQRQRAIIQKEADAAHQKYWDLVSRQQKLAAIRKESGTLLLGAGTIGGIGYYMMTQPGAEKNLEDFRDNFGTGEIPEEEEEKYFEQKRTGGFNYTKNMLNANSTGGARSDQSWQDPGVNRFSGNTNGVKADYYLKKGGLKQKVSSKFKKPKN
jgi:hypothetical protein